MWNSCNSSTVAKDIDVLYQCSRQTCCCTVVCASSPGAVVAVVSSNNSLAFGRSRTGRQNGATYSCRRWCNGDATYFNCWRPRAQSWPSCIVVKSFNYPENCALLLLCCNIQVFILRCKILGLICSLRVPPENHDHEYWLVACYNQ